MILSFLLLLRTKFELSETVILALFMGVATAAVMYPLMLRVNEWTDVKGLQAYTYTKSGAVKWRVESQGLPSSQQLPSLKFDYSLSDYWAQFEIGVTKDFELRKGALGFYQVNMEPIYEEQHAFYNR